MSQHAAWAELYTRGRAATERRHRNQVLALYIQGGAAVVISIGMLLVVILDTPPPWELIAGMVFILLIGLAMVGTGLWSQRRGPLGEPVVLRARVQSTTRLARFWVVGLAVAEAVRIEPDGRVTPCAQARAWTRVTVETHLGWAIKPTTDIQLLCTPKGHGVELLA
ncbi:hypothetical protein HC891_14115 [Candidatus Gracilibacteria bacterium]|nr:hypothetical protein [Candidatus Gracilibacteria bacterium]